MQESLPKVEASVRLNGDGTRWSGGGVVIAPAVLPAVSLVFGVIRRDLVSWFQSSVVLPDSLVLVPKKTSSTPRSHGMG